MLVKDSKRELFLNWKINSNLQFLKIEIEQIQKITDIALFRFIKLSMLREIGTNCSTFELYSAVKVLISRKSLAINGKKSRHK